MISQGLTSLLWFALILALIPLALWLLKRTPMGGAAAHGVLRSVAALHTMEPQADAAGSPALPAAAGFAQLFARLRQDKGMPGEI